jgi:hypothetical protein
MDKLAENLKAKLSIWLVAASTAVKPRL